MSQRILTLGHSPDPDDAFMFYGLAKGLIPTPGYRFEHILQDIQTLNERAERGEHGRWLRADASRQRSPFKGGNSPAQNRGAGHHDQRLPRPATLVGKV